MNHLNHGWKCRLEGSRFFPKASPASVILASGGQELISGLDLEEGGSEL